MSQAQKSKKGFGQIITTSDEGSRRKNTSTEPNLRFASQTSIGNNTKNKGKNSKIKEQLFSFGVKIPQIESEIYQTLFSITAELSDILSVQSLMRDFGLLKK